MKSEIALITGAKGFLGKHCALKFKNAGWKCVVGLGNGNWRRKNYAFWGIDQWISSSVTIEALESLKSPPDCIIHCAGGASVKASIVNPFDDFHRTVNSTLNVLEYCRRHSPKTHIVYPSSAAVYGKVKNQPIKESEKLNPVSTYGIYKKLAEELIMDYTHRYNLQTGIIRFFSVYGNELRKQLLWDACKKYDNRDFLFFGTGEETRDFVHIHDAVELIYIVSNAITSHPGLILNGGAGVGVTTRFILGTLLRCFNNKLSPHFSCEKKEGDPDHYIADISRAIRYGWKPRVDLKEGIRQYALWYQQRK